MNCLKSCLTYAHLRRDSLGKKSLKDFTIKNYLVIKKCNGKKFMWKYDAILCLEIDFGKILFDTFKILLDN